MGGWREEPLVVSPRAETTMWRSIENTVAKGMDNCRGDIYRVRDEGKHLLGSWRES
jgi:hypothetical protein